MEEKTGNLIDTFYYKEFQNNSDSQQIIRKSPKAKYQIFDEVEFTHGREILGDLIVHGMIASGGTDIDWLIEHNGCFIILEFKGFHNDKINIPKGQIIAYEKLHEKLNQVTRCYLYIVGCDDVDFSNPDSTMWIFEMKQWKNGAIPKNTNDIYDVALDHNGLLWIASQIGLISWNGTTFSLKSVPADLSATFYDVNVDSDNAIWVASAFGGIGKYSGGNWTTFASTFNPLERVENLAVLNSNEIWTSETGLGFYRYTGAFNTVPFASLGATEWYPNDVLYGDAQNRLWIQNQFTVLRYLTTQPSSTTRPSGDNQGINIYPNPAFNFVQIQCKNADDYITGLEIFSIEGQLIQSSSYQHQNQVEIAIGDWQPGVYCIKVKVSNGLGTLKFVKL